MKLLFNCSLSGCRTANNREFGEAFTSLIMDVTDRQAVERAAAKVSAQLGSSMLAGLVNNAGVAVPGPLLHLPAGRGSPSARCKTDTPTFSDARLCGAAGFRICSTAGT